MSNEADLRPGDSQIRWNKPDTTESTRQGESNWNAIISPFKIDAYERHKMIPEMNPGLERPSVDIMNDLFGDFDIFGTIEMHARVIEIEIHEFQYEFDAEPDSDILVIK